MIKKKFKDKYFVLWPQYFDSTLSKRMGRRVPKELAVPKPSQKEIIEACKELGREVIALEGRYPRQWWVGEGPVAVEKLEGESKRELLEKVARKLHSLRYGRREHSAS